MGRLPPRTRFTILPAPAATSCAKNIVSTFGKSRPRDSVEQPLLRERGVQRHGILRQERRRWVDRIERRWLIGLV